jgi:NAD(P) transhydrogenase subunit alpha
MALRVGVPKETTPAERRVAMVPAVVGKLLGLGAEVLVEAGACTGSYLLDEDYAGAGARLVPTAAELYEQADVVLKVQPPELAEIAGLRHGQVLLGFMAPHRFPDRVAALRDRGVTAFAVELIPRITRAQSMDALTSQASVAGYKAALMAACGLGRFFPMLTTPAGTIRPVKVLVLGAGVAGLQAIATSRRLGAVVEAYDVRPVTREQVESLGAKFLSLGLEAEAAGGYARELTSQEKERERDLIAEHVATADAVITTAAIPGKPSPLLVTADMVDAMKPGSVIIDLAAEGGGNCEVTRAGDLAVRGHVTIYGPLNVPSLLPVHASETYARNLLNFLALIVKDGELRPDWDDEIVAGSVLTREGRVCASPTLEAIQFAELSRAETFTPSEELGGEMEGAA